MQHDERYGRLVRRVEAAQRQLIGDLLRMPQDASERLVVHALDRSLELDTQLDIRKGPRSLYGRFVAHAANLVVGASVETLPDAQAVQALRRRTVPDAVLLVYQRLCDALAEAMDEVNAELADDREGRGRLELWEHGYALRKALDPGGLRDRDVAIHEAASLLISGLPDA